MFWNHRVLRRVVNEEINLFIVEVYYNSNDNSIIGWTESEEVWGETPSDLRQTLEWMLEALDRPVLDEEELLKLAKEAQTNRKDVYETGIPIGEVLDSLGLEQRDVNVNLPKWDGPDSP